MLKALDRNAYDFRLGKLKVKATWLHVLVHIGAALPGIVSGWALYQSLVDFTVINAFAVNPIQEITFRTGKYALVLLVLSLAMTPLNTVFRWRAALGLRKQLGLWSFFYALTHFLIFIWLDYGLRFDLIYEAIFEKRYALVGFTAFLILLPLALTSMKRMQKWLGKRWKLLHRFVYAAGLLVTVHYIWLVKSDYRQPLIYGAIILLLLALRLPIVKTWVNNIRSRLKQRQAAAGD